MKEIQTWTIFSLEWTTSPELELNLTLEIFLPPPNTSLTILYLTIVVSMFTGKLRIWKQDSTWNIGVGCEDEGKDEGRRDRNGDGFEAKDTNNVEVGEAHLEANLL